MTLGKSELRMAMNISFSSIRNSSTLSTTPWRPDKVSVDHAVIEAAGIFTVKVAPCMSR